MGSGSEYFTTLVGADFESRAPFGEAKTHLIIFGETMVEIIETVGVGFEGIVEVDEALVDFDAWDDAFADEVISESLAVVGALAGGFVEEDDATEIVFDTRGGEKDVTIIATVIISVLDA